jgi:competence protein ComEA
VPDDPALDAPLPWPTRARDAVASLRAQPTRLVFAALAVVAIGGGLWWLLRPPPVIPAEDLLPVVTTGAAGTGHGAGSGPSTTSPTTSTVVVHVAGAVVRSGVLHLPAGSRVVDAIAAAGGATIDADVDRVNLAAPLADGGWIHVPRVGEPASAPPGGGAGATPATAGPLDLNQATAAELEALPGIGPATAAAILAYREEHGPFASVDALGEVSGIGDAKLAQLRELVRV